VKIALDNRCHKEGNMRISATCPLDMCGIWGTGLEIKKICGPVAPKIGALASEDLK